MYILTYRREAIHDYIYNYLGLKALLLLLLLYVQLMLCEGVNYKILDEYGKYLIYDK
jgi:hypothetical protein